MMKKLFILGAVAGLAIVVSACTTSLYSSNTNTSGSSANTNTIIANGANANQSVNQTGTSSAVSIQNFSFSPSTLTVSRGTTVTWTNNDTTAHTITSTGFDSGTVAVGGTYSQTFNTVGTFNYHCSIHPSMNGQIIVQ